MAFRLSAFIISCLAAAQAVTGAATDSNVACNNSPSLCNRKYNNVTYLGAHDSPFVRNATNGFSSAGNQYYSTTVQLSAGVRLVTAQLQAKDTDQPATSSNLHLCHSSCVLLDAGTLSGWLAEIKTWMDANPNEVVTVLLVNGVNADAGTLAAEYDAAGITKYAYTPTSKTSTNNWPTLQQMISNGTRLVSFVADMPNNSAAPYLLNEWNYIFENDYNNASPTDYTCDVNRPSSLANRTTQAIGQSYMSLMNHFLYSDQAFGIQTPNSSYANITNAPSQAGPGNLGDAAANCASSYGKNPNFLLVDFFNIGPAIQTADILNGVSSPVGRAAVSQQAITTSAAVGSVTVSTSVAGICIFLVASLLF